MNVSEILCRLRGVISVIQTTCPETGRFTSRSFCISVSSNDNEQEMYKPIEYAYQVGRNVFAGEHPLFDIYKRSAKGNIPALLRFGITVFLDLPQSYEAPEYAWFLSGHCLNGIAP